MKYEFGKTVWMEENPEGDVAHQSIEKMHQEIEDKIRASIEALLESQENFLGKGMTAEVHFLEKDRGLCYKIIRKIDVMARPDAVDSLPDKYREIYDRNKAAEEKAKKTPSGSKESSQIPWHVDLYSEAKFLSRARSVDPEGPVKVPRPDARLEIVGKEEGEGFEVVDSLEVLLMERMNAVSVDDLILKQLDAPANFDYNRYCREVEEFIAKMHENKLYHRDLHGGNAMIDLATGSPVIIDFGRSSISTEEEAYLEEIRPGEKMHFIRDEQMFRDKIKTPLAQYLAHQRLTNSAK
ncbi:MAG TPA: hypothetical protein VFT82_03430 [Candidatus Paceibacterota bacterium]|nr:hypothetical protein [Candidatus Paceibacterota bacterium]